MNAPKQMAITNMMKLTVQIISFLPGSPYPDFGLCGNGNFVDDELAALLLTLDLSLRYE